MIKRNFNAPDLTGTIDIEGTASVVVDKFFDSYFIKKEKYTKSIAGVMTKDSMMRWLENLVAMIKRNFNSPELVGVVDIEDTAIYKFF